MANRTGKSFTTWVLVALTSVYAIAFYYLAIQTKTCDIANAAISSNWFHGFWDKFLACRQINELGDTLGGAFAPVAFLWLAGTVFIQSQELAAQRQELDETQSVMREQLEVARQQVEETKASTSLFRKQTEILERDQFAREQDRVDAEFDEMVENFLSFIFGIDGFKFSVSIWFEASAPGLDGKGETVTIFDHTTTFKPFPDTRFSDLSDLARVACNEIDIANNSMRHKTNQLDRDNWDERKLKEICDQVDTLCDQIDRLSTKHKILASRYRLPALRASLVSLQHVAGYNLKVHERPRTDYNTSALGIS
ncbi:hypothetical protein LJR011_004950 [Agrobacterium tumefaciens]